MAQQKMKIPIGRVIVKFFTIGNGIQSKDEDHLYQGQLPKRYFIAMVTNTAFNGGCGTNSFCSQHHNLSKLNVPCNGHSILIRPFELDKGCTLNHIYHCIRLSRPLDSIHLLILPKNTVLVDTVSGDTI